ncbi:four helix bundle protein [Olivibacter sp. XZL3]|uniref:four helix bundle protein n=1 Tax=Olivibacter sp. XZL3 TaxID=1735116 RepID=UPI0010653CD2|nr:four helix bundle protein [Olivibacter sp. XZL3]
MKTHKDLDVWKKSIDLVTVVYIITERLPKEEIYGLTSQIRRCSVSIPSNIAEGSARQGKKEFIYFLYIALGSIAELETQLIIAEKLKYLTPENNRSVLPKVEEIRKMLVGLIKFVKSR